MILYNNTVDPIELVDLGITIPSGDYRDISGKSRSRISVSAELIGHITLETIKLVRDENADPVTFWDVASATDFIRYGVNKTALGLGDGSFLAAPSGPTSERPVEAESGAIRHNTTTGMMEIYVSDAWHSLPKLGGIEFKVDPASTILYRKVGTKFLSVGFSNLVYSNSNTANMSWLYIDSAITKSSSGYASGFPGTVVVATAYSDDPAPKTISLYINDTEHSNILTFGGVNTTASASISVDFNVGDKVRYRVRSNQSGKLGAVYLTSFFNLRML